MRGFLLLIKNSFGFKGRFLMSSDRVVIIAGSVYGGTSSKSPDGTTAQVGDESSADGEVFNFCSISFGTRFKQMPALVAFLAPIDASNGASYACNFVSWQPDFSGVTIKFRRLTGGAGYNASGLYFGFSVQGV
jgi:hypothetical protein